MPWCCQSMSVTGMRVKLLSAWVRGARREQGEQAARVQGRQVWLWRPQAPPEAERRGQRGRHGGLPAGPLQRRLWRGVSRAGRRFAWAWRRIARAQRRPRRRARRRIRRRAHRWARPRARRRAGRRPWPGHGGAGRRCAEACRRAAAGQGAARGRGARRQVAGAACASGGLLQTAGWRRGAQRGVAPEDWTCMHILELHKSPLWLVTHALTGIRACSCFSCAHGLCATFVMLTALLLAAVAYAV